MFRSHAIPLYYWMELEYTYSFICHVYRLESATWFQLNINCLAPFERKMVDLSHSEDERKGTIYGGRGVSKEKVWEQIGPLLENWKDEVVQFHLNGLTTLFTYGDIRMDLHRPRFEKTYEGTTCNYYNLAIEDGYVVHASIHVAEGHNFGPDKIGEAFRASLATGRTAVLLPPYLCTEMEPVLEEDIIFQQKLRIKI